MKCLMTMAVLWGMAVGAADAQQKAAAGAAPARAMTIVGTVVDAACYMMHPAAAGGDSHEECGSACIARGVPVAIANEADKKLYFLAGDARPVGSMLHQRVRATGTVTEKREPMELKMPVGEHNEMVVRVEGGYRVIAIEKVTLAPARRP